MRLLICALGTLALVGCDSEDIGDPCGDNATGLSSEPVVDEDPLNEVVRIERDTTCETLQCLKHLGLEPYCTRSCELENADSQSCTSDSDCSRPQYCLDGRCIDDDCPEGFWCRGIQEVGPFGYAPQSPNRSCTNRYDCRRQEDCVDGTCQRQSKFCTRRTDCTSNLDCEAPGEIACRALGCFDSCCLEDPGTGTVCNCDSPQRRCQPFNELPCQCISGGVELADCPPEQLTCSTQNQAWPTTKTPFRFSVCQKT